MKKLLTTLTLILLAFVLLVGCEEKVSTQPLKDLINGIETVYSLDTDFDNEEYDGNDVNGSGSIVLVKGQDQEIDAIYAAEKRTAMIEIYYTTKLFSSKIKVDDLTITYLDLSAELYVEVNFWDGDKTAEYESLEALVEYLSTLKIDDVREVLLELGYLDKPAIQPLTSEGGQNHG